MVYETNPCCLLHALMVMQVCQLLGKLACIILLSSVMCSCIRRFLLASCLENCCMASAASAPTGAHEQSAQSLYMY